MEGRALIGVAPIGRVSAGPAAGGVMKQGFDDARDYVRRFPMWSDRVEKRRRVLLPDCGVIDTSDMDDGRLPVGARLREDLQVDGQRVESRLVLRTGDRDDDWIFAAFQWSEDGSEATLLDGSGADGVTTLNRWDVRYDIPSEAQCVSCHGGSGHGGVPSRIIGFSALQLDHEGPGLTLDQLAVEGRLSQLPPEKRSLDADEKTEETLGVLHGNCAHCHNDTGEGVQFVNEATFDLRRSVYDRDPESAGAYRTAVGRETHWCGGADWRVAPGEPANSAIWIRMASRESAQQMPPIGTHVVDEGGSGAVEDWVEGL